MKSEKIFTSSTCRNANEEQQKISDMANRFNKAENTSVTHLDEERSDIATYEKDLCRAPLMNKPVYDKTSLSESDNIDPPKNRACSWFAKLGALLGCTISIGMLRHYIRFGQRPIREPEWISGLPRVEQTEARELISVLNGSDTRQAIQPSRRDIHLGEIAMRLFAALWITPQSLPNNSFFPECAKTAIQKSYWSNILQKKYDVEHNSALHAAWLEYISLNHSPVNSNTDSSSSPHSLSDDISERNAWLHTLGASREIPKLDHQSSVRLVDKIIQEKIYKTFAIKPTIKELDRKISIKVDYEIESNKENAVNKTMNFDNMTLREILVQQYKEKLKSSNQGNDENILIKNITFNDDRNSSRISYLEFIANNEFSILGELEHTLDFFSSSPDIDDAYTLMAKNRLAITLFPLLDDEKDSELLPFVKRWLNGAVKEKLISLPGQKSEIMVPDTIALVEATGGVLVSLTTRSFYPWTPDDESENLKNFLIQHLSAEEERELSPTVWQTSMVQSECAISPGISFISPDDIWQALKNINIRKLHSHLAHYRLGAPSPDKEQDPHNFAQKALMGANVVVSLLAFFVSGGSAAGCSAIMLANLFIGGASSGLYIDTALQTTDKHSREQAWDTVLFSVIMTGLGGANDIYSIIKALGSEKYKLLFKSANIIKGVLTAGGNGKSIVEIGKNFIKATPRQRALLLVESFLHSKDPHLDVLSTTNIDSMIKVLQIAGRLKSNIKKPLTSLFNVRSLLKAKKVIHDRQALSSIFPGNEVAVIDSKTEEIKLLMMSLGEGKFAGFGLHDIFETDAHNPKWQSIDKNDFVFSNNKLILRNGGSGSVVTEGSSALGIGSIGKGIPDTIEVLDTRFQRYCNRLKFDHLSKKFLSELAFFAEDNGFKEITYRVLYIWSGKFDNVEQRHYLLAAKRQGVTYILEPAPENIHFLNLPGLSSARILPEYEWIAFFKESGSPSLVTYRDFTAEDAAIHYHRIDDLQNSAEKTLITPDEMSTWQSTDRIFPTSYSEFAIHYKESSKKLIIIKNVRDEILNDHSSVSSYEFILNILNKSGVIDRNLKEFLSLEFKLNPLSLSKGFMRNNNPITSYNDILRVGAGQLVFFQCLENSAISHIVLGLGNGRFTGMGNGILNSALSHDKRTVVIEQLGHFQEEIFHSYNAELTYSVYLFEPFALETTRKSLYEAAIEVVNNPEEHQNVTRFVLGILVKANHIAPQQAYALERLICVIFGSLDGNTISLVKLNKLLISNEIINNSDDLQSVSAGKLVLFYGINKDFHILLSLGDNRFIGMNNNLLNSKIPSEQFVITVDQIGEIINGKMVNNDLFSSIIAGEVNLEQTRISALLGPDGRLDYIERAPGRFSLEIKAHGAAASVNHYNAIELSDIIDGINLYMHPGKIIEHIDLISCYGAFGGERSSAQIIADRLGITVEGYKGVVVDSKKLRRGQSIAFRPHDNYGFQRIKENERWHIRIHDFTEFFLELWYKPSQQQYRRAISDQQPLALIIIDIMHVLKKDLTLSSFMLRYPNLVSTATLPQALAIVENASDPDNIRTALLSIIYDNEQIKCLIDSYIMINERNNQSTGAVVRGSFEMCRSYEWEQFAQPLSVYKKLTPIISYGSLREGSNIYIYYDGGVNNIFRESLLRMNSQCDGSTQWPQALASFINAYNNFLPILVGRIHGDILSTSKNDMGNYMYLNPVFTSDFSLQIAVDRVGAVLPENEMQHYVFHDSTQTKSRNIDARDRLDFSSFVFKDDKLFLNTSHLFHADEHGQSLDVNASRNKRRHLQYLPRFLITIMENGERIILLQRNFPAAIKRNNSELAFYIANEINKYTAAIRVGEKRDHTIIPVKSDTENYIYVDPGCAGTSWVSLSIVTG